MNSTATQFNREFVELLLLTVDGAVNEEQFNFLQKQIVSNDDAMDLYCDFLATYVGLSHYGKFAYSSLNKPEPNSEYDVLLALLADNERAAPAVQIEKPDKLEFMPIEKEEVTQQKRHVSKLSIYTLLFSAAAMLLIILMVTLPPVRPIVATLTDSINAEWGNTKDIPANGDLLRQGALTLTKGLAEITFDDGAVVVVEAPAVIELESPKSMLVNTGKIGAFVSKYATGFTVNTPGASIVDLGTEFGVDVQYDGSCDLYMFTGKANLIVGQEGQERTSQLVRVKQAKSVNGTTGRIRDISLQKNSFVRCIDSQTGLVWKGQEFNLADVVGGGNGFGTGKIGYAINLETGRVSPQRIIEKLQKRGPGQIRPVGSLSFVDCLFVPDGGRGDVTISTTGLTFSDCPDTNGNSWGDIVNGGLMRHGPVPERHHKMALGGTIYGTVERPAIYIHGNQGVTFDLDAIRAAMPGINITSLTTLCGISQTVVDDPRYSRKPDPVADMWVLVDGQSRFSSVGMKVGSDPVSAQVDLNGEDRFLTLVVTDGGDGNTYDWGIFAEPVLHLEQ